MQININQLNKTFIYVLFIITFYQSVYSHLIYSFWISLLFVGCIKELFYYKNNYCKILILIYLFTYYHILFTVGRGTVLLLILNNMISKAFQNIGNTFGEVSIFSFTPYTFEAGFAGLILTQQFLDLGKEYITYNFIGILSSIFYSYLKDKLIIREWSSKRFNDTLDNIMIPLFYISLVKCIESFY